MPGPSNPGLSVEAQHVINSLEAHFAAIGKALQAGAPSWLEAHVESAFEAVQAKLESFGAKFSHEFDALKAQATGGAVAGSTPPAAAPTAGTAKAPTASAAA